MKQLDIEGSAKIGSVNSYLGGKNESFGGIFVSTLPNQMKKMGIRDPSQYSQNERFDDSSWDKDGFVDSDGENPGDLNSFNRTTGIKNTSDPCKKKFNPVTKPNHGMQNEDWSDGMSSSGTMSSVFTLQGGIHNMNDNTQTSIAVRNEFSKSEECYTQGVHCVSQTEASRSCLRDLMLCYSNRAATRMSLQRVRDALEDCMKAAALDPNFIRVQLRTASCYLALGEVENATFHFMECLQAGSDPCAYRKL